MDPGVPVHATRTIRKGFSYLGSVEFHCNANYKLEGVPQIFCKRDGTWSRPIPKCFGMLGTEGVSQNKTTRAETKANQKQTKKQSQQHKSVITL